MLISTDCNYIYCSIVTEIDKFMLNLVNLSITFTTEFNNYLLHHPERRKGGEGGRESRKCG